MKNLLSAILVLGVLYTLRKENTVSSTHVNVLLLSFVRDSSYKRPHTTYKKLQNFSTLFLFPSTFHTHFSVPMVLQKVMCANVLLLRIGLVIDVIKEPETQSQINRKKKVSDLCPRNHFSTTDITF